MIHTRYQHNTQLIRFLIISLFFVFDFYGQEARFEHITLEDGLSNSKVLSILQDSKGFLWFGTQDGLNKYDGYKITVYRHDPNNKNSISNDKIYSINEDKKGALWIGTKGGLNRYDRMKDQFTSWKSVPGNKNSLSSNAVLSICIEPEHDGQVLWLGTMTGLNRFDYTKGKFTHYKIKSENSKRRLRNLIYKLFKSENGFLWLGTHTGLALFDLKTEKFIPSLNKIGKLKNIIRDMVFSIIEDHRRDNELWIGTVRSGLIKLNLLNGKIKHYKDELSSPLSRIKSTISTLFWDQEGGLWMGTTDKLFRYNLKKDELLDFENNPVISTSISDKAIRSIYQDRSGIIWIGTHNGLNKYNYRKNRFLHYKHKPGNSNSLSNNNVNAIFEDRTGKIWIGTKEGLNCLNRQDNQFTHYKSIPGTPVGLSNDKITYIIEYPDDTNEVLWIGTSGGLNKLNKRSGTFTHYIHNPQDPSSISNNIIHFIYKDSSDRYWICTFSGLNLFNRNKMTFKHWKKERKNPNSLSHNQVFNILEEKKDVYWVGTNNGLDKFDYKKNKFIHYRNDPNNPNSICSNSIYSLYLSSNRHGKTLWIGTDNGLAKMTQKKNGKIVFKSYKIKDGLPNKIIGAILADNQDYLWLSTNKGLSKFNPKTEVFKNYDRFDGLQNYQYTSAAFKNIKGELIFGGINGFNVFNPLDIKNNAMPPKLVLTSFKKFNKSIELENHISEIDTIKLNYKDYLFSFEFAALDYSQPLKNQYKYKMEGFNEDWIHAGSSRQATFTNLDPKTYVFKVKGSNSDGVWNEKELSVRIFIKPPFWQTWWFQASGIFLFLILIVVLHKIRTYNIKKRNKKLEESNAKLNEQIVERIQVEEKLKILRNYLKNIVDSMPSILIGVNPDGKVTQWNKEAESVTGVSTKDADGSFVSSIFPQLSVEMKKIKRAIKERKSIKNEKFVLVVNKQKRISDITIYPLITNGVEGAVIRIDDISEKVRLEEMMIQSEKMMSVGGLAAGMAHEINNPLGIILLCIQNITRRLSPESDKNLETAKNNGLDLKNLQIYLEKRGILKYINEIREAGLRASKIINNMLSFSRKSISGFNPHNIQKLLNGTVELAENDYDLKKKYDFRQISIIRYYEEGVPEITCEATEIQQVFLNILKNGAQALSYDHKKIVKDEHYDKIKPSFILRIINESKFVRIEIEDNGPGMAQDVLKRIFEPFFTTKATNLGTGLGLSISYFIINENHKGTLEVESELGKGTKFIIRLPVRL